MPNKHRSHAGKFTRSAALSAGDVWRGGVSEERFVAGGKALRARARSDGRAEELKRAPERPCRKVRSEPGEPPPFGRGYVNRKGWRMHLSYLGKDFEVPAVAIAFWGDSSLAAERWLNGFRLKRLCGKAGCLEPTHFYEYHPEREKLEEDSHMTPKLIHQLFATAAERGEAKVAFRKRGSAMHARFQLYAWRKKHRERNRLEEGTGPWDGVQVSVYEEGERWVVRLEQDETEVLSELVEVEGRSTAGLGPGENAPHVPAPELTPEEARRIQEIAQRLREEQEEKQAPGPLKDTYVQAFIKSTPEQESQKQESASTPEAPLQPIEKDGIVWQPSAHGPGPRPPQTEEERMALEEYERTGRSHAVRVRKESAGEPEPGPEPGKDS